MMNAYLLGMYQGNGHISIDNYFEYCIRDLPSYLADWQITAIRPGPHSDLSAVCNTVIPSRALWDNYVRWPARLTALSADLFHVVDQNIAWYFALLRTGKKIITVHDLIELMKLRKRFEFGQVSRRLAWKLQVCAQQIRNADRIVCVSRNTADCVMTELGIKGSRIHIVSNMIPSEFSPLSPEEKMHQRKSLFGDTGVLLMHAGRPSTYKNRTAVIKIFENVRKKYPDAKLILTSTPLTELEHSAIQDKSTLDQISIRFPQTRSELRTLYSISNAFVFPSLYEGFGWPPIEAMACGCPVISSTCGSLAEVVADAAITLSDPQDHAGFAAAVLRVLREPSLAADLIKKGYSNCGRFRSDVVMPQLAEVYRLAA